MKKKYYSNTQVSIVVTFGDSYRRVSFDGRTSGGSTLYVEDKELQDAIERHPRFGELFLLDKTSVQEPAPEPKKVKKASKPKVLKVSVPCIEDAKDYLANNFGESRTKMRGIQNIKILAAMHKVVFDCPELEEKADEPEEGQNP